MHKNLSNSFWCDQVMQLPWYTFLRETERLDRIVPAWRHLLGDNDVDHAGCFKGEFLLHMHCPFQRKWDVIHNYDISVLQQVSIFINGMTKSKKVSPLFRREIHRVLITWRTDRVRISNVKSNRRCKQSYPIDLRTIRCVSFEYDQPYRENIS